MDPLFHFVFAFIAGMAVNVRLRHRVLWVLGAAFSAVLIDVDHFLFAYPRAFHTVFVTWLLPALLFYVAYRYERGRESIRLQSLVLLLFVMLNGHLVADLFNEGAIRLLYPVSRASISIPADLTVALNERWLLVSPEGVALTLYGMVIGLAYFAEEFIYFFERQHEGLEAAVRDALAR
jgi:membrane-bound metal-dependent hydrolase YbcI (DUF457 family)